MRRTSILLFTTLLLAACATTQPPQPKAQPAAQAPFLGEHGFEVAGLDRTVAPCDDFYRFATGKWRESHPLPPQYARFGRFEELA